MAGKQEVLAADAHHSRCRSEPRPGDELDLPPAAQVGVVAHRDDPFRLQQRRRLLLLLQQREGRARVAHVHADAGGELLRGVVGDARARPGVGGLRLRPALQTELEALEAAALKDNAVLVPHEVPLRAHRVAGPQVELRGGGRFPAPAAARPTGPGAGAGEGRPGVPQPGEDAGRRVVQACPRAACRRGGGQMRPHVHALDDPSTQAVHRDEEARLGVAELDRASVRHGLVRGLAPALREHLPDAAVVKVRRDLGAYLFNVCERIRGCVASASVCVD